VLAAKVLVISSNIQAVKRETDIAASASMPYIRRGLLTESALNPAVWQEERECYHVDTNASMKIDDRTAASKSAAALSIVAVCELQTSS
jgi:hypothetical protein